MKVGKIETFLRVGGRTLDRNFSFTVTNGLNSTQKLAAAHIKRDYWLANDIPLALGGGLAIGMAVNGEAAVEIFSGSVSALGETSAHFTAEAIFKALDAEPLNETFKGLSYKEAFAKLADPLDYRAENPTPLQLVLKGTPGESFASLLSSLSRALDKPVCHYLDGGNRLVIATELGGGKGYAVDGMLLDAQARELHLFPIPLLEIGDSLSWGGQKKTVTAIRWETSLRAQAAVSVQDSSEEELQYFDNPKLLKELALGFKEHLVTLAKEVKAEMKETFKPIHITSAWRSKDRQIELLLDKLDAKLPKYNMYKYYSGTKISAPFLKIIQNLYDGLAVTEADYQAIANPSNREQFKQIIQANPIRAHSRDDAKKVLEISYRDKSLYHPSLHVSAIKNKATAVDLRTSKSSENLLTKHKSAGYNGYDAKDIGDPHLHLTNAPK